MSLESVPIGALVEDFSIYPRHAVDPTHVSQLAEALRAGQTLPPPIVEKDTLRYVDGWHRGRAFRRVYGPDASIQIDVRSYKNKRELVRAAVDANMEHGRRLDRIDRVRCAVLLQEVGLAPQQIALVLRVREPQLERMKLLVAPVPAGAEGAVPGTTKLPIKRAILHMAGEPLSASQARAHASMPGTSLTLLAKQLTSALKSGFVDPKNDRLRLALEDLHAALTVFLEPHEEPT